MSRQLHAVSRRSFLTAVAGGAALGAAGTAGATARRVGDAGKARNLIFMVADGVSPGAIKIGDLYCQRRLGRRMHLLDWIDAGDARRAVIATDSANTLVTDSAASSTAWSIGERVNNGAICVTPDGREPAPLFVRLKASGRRVGVVTTTNATDASPAAMCTNSPTRADMRGIARQMAQRLDLIIGGGREYFDHEALRLAPDAALAPTLDALRATPPNTRAFALLEDGELPYEIERPGETPNFAELTRAAIERMVASGAPFALFIENEHTDTAAHQNDAPTIMHDMVAFDAGLKLALDFVRSRDDTLLVVTTDHANTNVGFARYASDSHATFDRMFLARRSLQWVRREFDGLGEGAGAAEMAELVHEAQGVRLTAADIEKLDKWLRREQVDPFLPRNRYYSPLGSVMGNHFGVAFATYTHTADDIESLAMGPGSERMPRVGHHVDIHRMIVEAMGIA